MEAANDEISAILFSYDEPIAVRFTNGGFVGTNHRWTVTTTRHQSLYRAAVRPLKPQEVCRSRLRELVGLPDTQSRVWREGRRTIRDGYRVQIGDGGPQPWIPY